MKRNTGRYIEIDESQDYGTIQSNTEDCLYGRTMRRGNKNYNRAIYEFEPEVSDVDTYKDENKLDKVFDYMFGDTNIVVSNDVYCLDDELLEEYKDSKYPYRCIL